MLGTEPAGWGIPAVLGKRRRRHRRALRSSPGPEPAAGISPKDGTEHGWSIPVTTPEKNSKGFMYETRDPSTSGIISQRNRSCPAPAFPLGKAALGKAGRTCEHAAGDGSVPTASTRREIREPRC